MNNLLPSKSIIAVLWTIRSAEEYSGKLTEFQSKVLRAVRTAGADIPDKYYQIVIDNLLYNKELPQQDRNIILKYRTDYISKVALELGFINGDIHNATN